MRFTIGLKIVVLVSALVSVTIYILGLDVAEKGGEVLVDHELVDLNDETHLAGRRILSFIQTMREDVLYLAGTEPIQGIIRARDPARDISPEAREAEEEKHRQQLIATFERTYRAGQDDSSQYKPYLQIRFLEGEQVNELVRVERTDHGIRPVGEEELECLSTAGDQHTIDSQSCRQTMKLGRQQIFMSDVDLHREDGSQEGQPVLRASVPVYPPGASAAFGVVMINLDMRPIAKQLKASARHLTFLTDDQGRYLVHPDASREFAHKIPGRIGPQDDPRQFKIHTLYSELAKVFDSTPDEQPPVATDAPIEMFMPVAVDLPTDNAPVLSDMAYHYVKIDVNGPPLPSDPVNAVIEKVRDESDPKLRWSGGGADITRLTVSSKIEGVVPRLVEELEAAFPGRINPDKMIFCETFSFRAYKLPFDPASPERFLLLVRAASYEEIKADADAIESHFHGLLGFFIPASVVLAFLFSYLLTRPLKKIADVTQDIALSGNTTGVKLPVSARDEIGDLARSFQHMIEQLQHRETTIKESEARLRAIVNTAAEGIITIDELGLVESANSAAETIFGYDDGEVADRPFKELLAGESKGEYDRQLGRHLDNIGSSLSASGGNTEFGRLQMLGTQQQLVGRRKDGSSFPIELSVSKVRLGPRRMFTGIIRDITERKQAEGEIKQLAADLELRVIERTAELQRTNEMLELARDAALDASRAKDTFLANMSHELRNPLNAIIGFSEMLEEDATDAGQEEFVPDLQKIHSAGKHLLGLINDVLDIAKISAGTITVQPTDFSVASMLRSLIDMTEPLVEKKQNRLHLELADDLGEMHADEGRVRQVLFNLMSNAAKFTEAGDIRFSATRETVEGADWIQFVVKDSGIGMTEEEIGRLFQRFSQVSGSTRHKQDGAGLGLALSQELCRLMGGKIGVESQPGEGSTFTATLPARSVSAVDADAVPGPTVSLDLSLPLPSKADGTLLVIDDDPTVRDLMTRFLSKEGYQVVTAASGEEGLRLAKEVRPIAITLDTVMPGIDGWGVLAALKADEVTADVPVIMVTMVDDEGKGYALGASDYLTKPVDWTRLSAVLQKLQCQRTAGPVLVVDDDPTARELMVRMLGGDGWETVQAEHGRQALERLAEQIPSLILLDLMMPEMDGFELLRELRRNESWQTIPVVVVTARDLSEEDRRQLAGSVRQVIAKGGAGQSELLLAIHRAIRGGVQLEPSAKGESIG
jgi:signal transduction histidine kinase/DNA-binding response OmpR family regulator/HAMP domain-containing protein